MAVQRKCRTKNRNARCYQTIGFLTRCSTAGSALRLRVAADDIVIWILRIVSEQRRIDPLNAIVNAEQMTRVHWGGARPYIAKTRARDRAERARLRHRGRG